jgi:hypothetical protein
MRRQIRDRSVSRPSHRRSVTAHLVAAALNHHSIESFYSLPCARRADAPMGRANGRQPVTGASPHLTQLRELVHIPVLIA